MPLGDPLEGLVEKALSRVRDPELDMPITELGMVKDVALEKGFLRVTILMPTYWCSPNFTYIILEDARRELDRELRPLGVKPLVVLEGHHDAEKITRCVNEGLRFEECYQGEAVEGLEELRLRFREKALLARLRGLVTLLSSKGLGLADISALKIEDVGVEGDT